MGPEVIRQGKAEGKGCRQPSSGAAVGERRKGQASSASSAAKNSYDRSQDRRERSDANATMSAIHVEEEEEGKVAPPKHASSSKRKGAVGVTTPGGDQSSTKSQGGGHGSVGGGHGSVGGGHGSVGGGHGSVGGSKRAQATVVDPSSRTTGGGSSSEFSAKKSGGSSSEFSAKKREQNRSGSGTAPSKEPVTPSALSGSSASSAGGIGIGIAGPGVGAGAVIGGGARAHVGSSSDEAARRSPLSFTNGKLTKNAILEYGGPAAMISRLADAADFDDSLPDAASEKDRGNDLFRQGRFADAIDCYSRSIAMRPTCIAFANRAMALLKLKRYKEAEEDCTEAIELDDMYVKAYARRGSARKELNKYLEAAEDLEYSLDLEPENKELRQQLQSVLPFCDKEGRRRRGMTPHHLSSLSEESPLSVMGASALSRPAAHFTTASLSASSCPSPDFTTEISRFGITDLTPEDLAVPTADGASKANSNSTLKVLEPRDLSRLGIADLTPADLLAVSPRSMKGGGDGGCGREREAKSVASHPIFSDKGCANLKKKGGEPPAPPPSTAGRVPGGRSPTPTPGPAQVQQAVAAAKAIAARVAAAARQTLAKKVSAPKTAYEFEIIWKSLEDDRPSQARVLGMVDPSSLTKIFKDALSAHLLCDIIDVIDECLMPDDAGRGIEIIEKLTRVGRFDITIMFLSAQQKEKLRHLWEGSSKAAHISPELQGRLQSIRVKYRV